MSLIEELIVIYEPSVCYVFSIKFDNFLPPLSLISVHLNLFVYFIIIVFLQYLIDSLWLCIINQFANENISTLAQMVVAYAHVLAIFVKIFHIWVPL